MATKRKASGSAGSSPQRSGPGPSHRPELLIQYPTNTRTHTIYRVIFEDIVPVNEDEEPEEIGDDDTPSEQIASYLTLIEANARAHKQVGEKDQYEWYSIKFDDDNLIDIRGTYVVTGHSFRLSHAHVEKETITLPELFNVLKRRANEEMTPGEVSIAGTYVLFEDAEKAVQEEITTYQARLEAGRRRAEAADGTLGCRIVHRKGDGKSVFSRGVVEFDDLRDEFPVVWVQRSALEIGKEAAIDETDYGSDRD